MKFFIIILILIKILYANEDIIKFQAKIFPKILNYDLDLDKKVHNKKLKFAIIYNNLYYVSAINLKEFIENRYSKIKNYKLDILLIHEDNLKDNLKNLNAIYLFDNLKSSTTKEVLNYSIKNSAIIFANRVSMLKDKAMVGIEIKKAFIIYINAELLKEAKINFDLSFLKVAEKYE